MKLDTKILFVIVCTFISLPLSASSDILKRDSLFEILSIPQKSTEHFSAYSTLIDILKNEDINQAFHYCKTATEQARKQKNAEWLNFFTLKIGELERLIGQYDSAIFHIKKSINTSQIRGYKEQEAQAKLLLAKVYLDLSMIDLSYEKLMEAKQIFSEINNVRGIEEVRNIQGCILFTEKKYKEAIDIFTQSKTVNSSHQFLDLLVFNNLNLGLIYTDLGQKDRAKRYYEEALNLSLRQNFDLLSIMVYKNFSYMYISENELKKAENYILKAIDLSEQTQNKKQLVYSMSVAGTVYDKMGDSKRALDYFTKIVELAPNLGLMEAAKNACDFLTQYYLQRKEYKQAAKYFELKAIYVDSVVERRNIPNLTRIRCEYQYKEQTQELIYKNRLRSMWIIFGISITVLLITTSLLLTFSRYKFKLKNAELERKNIENDLELKKKEVFTKILYLCKKNEAISDTARKLLKKKPLFKIENQPIIDEIVKELHDYSKDDSWKEFELRFEEIHSDFYKKLNDHFPDLTKNEKRLCAYFRLNISNKDVASLLHMSVAGVESARYRLRKKLDINSMDIDIVVFLENLSRLPK